jgi:hypothetical protein
MYVVQYNIDGGDWITVSSTSTASPETFDVSSSGNYQARVAVVYNSITWGFGFSEIISYGGYYYVSSDEYRLVTNDEYRKVFLS